MEAAQKERAALEAAEQELLARAAPQRSASLAEFEQMESAVAHSPAVRLEQSSAV